MNLINQIKIYFMKIFVDNVIFRRLLTNILSVWYTVQVNLMKNGILRALPTMFYTIDTIMEHLATNANQIQK